MRYARVVLVLLVATVAAAGTAEFTAEIVKCEGKDRVTKGTLSVKGDVYRLEFPDPKGPRIYSVSDPKNDLVRVFVPRYKLYMEDKCSSAIARMSDPFLMLPMIREHYESKDAGTESFGGYECAKETLGSGDQVAVTIWNSTKLGFPLKILFSGAEDQWIEVRNVKEAAVPDDLMAIPEGFTKSDRETIANKIEADPEMKAKREAWEANRPRKKSYGKLVKAGAEVRILIGNATAVTAGLKYPAPNCKWTLEATKGGESVLEKRAEPYVGKVEVKMPEGKIPDLVIGRCLEGDGYFSVDLVGKLPLILATKTTSRQERGGPSWTVPQGCQKVTLVFSVAADHEGNMKGILTYGDGKGNGKNEVFVLKPGESKTFELTSTEEQTVRDVGYTIQFGEVTIEVTEDMRPPEEQKPF